MDGGSFSKSQSSFALPTARPDPRLFERAAVCIGRREAGGGDGEHVAAALVVRNVSSEGRQSWRDAEGVRTEAVAASASASEARWWWSPPPLCLFCRLRYLRLCAIEAGTNDAEKEQGGGRGVKCGVIIILVVERVVAVDFGPYAAVAAVEVKEAAEGTFCRCCCQCAVPCFFAV